MVKQLFWFLLALSFAGTSIAQEKNLHFLGDFESGQISAKSTMRDGFYVATLPNPQLGAQTLHSPQSDFGPSSNADTRVVRSDVVGGETVKPRSGEFFLRSEISRSKNYLDLNGYRKNRPRSKIYLSDKAHRFDFDQEGYVGFSIYVPRSFESETGVRDHRGAITLFTIACDPVGQQVDLGQWVQAPSNEAHWFLRYWLNSKIASENGGTVTTVDLGPVRADAGQWTDFVFRYRFNPFSVDTNPANAGIRNSKNQLYQGNKGILQVWKAEGSADQNGERKLSLRIDKVNTPIGSVPHATEKLVHYWRLYKFGWVSNPTSLTRPIWMGFDEIRQGLVDRDGTAFADVAPSGAACTTGCGNGEGDKPLPPSNLVVAN